MFSNIKMSENSSFDMSDYFFNSSDPPLECLSLPESLSILEAFTIVNILFLFPLFAFILFLGLQQWRKQRSSTAAVTISHSDAFTYHMVTMEMLAMLTCACYCVGVYMDHLEMMKYSIQLFNATWCVKIQFHMLTCVELHLAVVHPVLYLQLKDSDGVRVRNISVGCVWLLCLVFGTIACLHLEFIVMVLYFSLAALVLIIVTCCCISVLWTLRRPAPGDGNKDGVDQSKRRAFNAIFTIMVVLLLCFSGMLTCDALEASVLHEVYGCILTSCVVWFTLPSSLVLPLLFLQRAGKLPCWKH